MHLGPVRRLMAAVFVALALAADVRAQRLVPANEPTLVDCDGQPCFRLTFNAVDSAGQPQPLPANPTFTVTDTSGSYNVFYVSELDTGVAQRRNTYWMLLLDMSGSMLERLGTTTRFEAAREAIRDAVGELRPGVDHFALAPFESHRVRQGVAEAVFEDSAAGALARLAALSRPAIANNTALYTATDEALRVLKRYQDSGNDVSLVVFTDGRNDVRPDRGDDRELLGDEGLALVRERAKQFNIQVRTIGFGARGQASFDEAALTQLAWPSPQQYTYAATAADVKGILTSNVKALATRFRLTLGPVRRTKGELRASTLDFSVAGTAGGATFRTETPILWVAPPIQEPSASGSLTAAEEKAFFAQGVSIPVSPWQRWLGRLTALGIFSSLLAIGWFGVPRFLWPERYIPRPVLPPAPRMPSPPPLPQPPGGGRRPVPVESRPQPPQPPPDPAGHTRARMTPARDDDSGFDRRSGAPPQAPAYRPPRAPQPRDGAEPTIFIPRGKKYEKDS